MITVKITTDADFTKYSLRAAMLQAFELGAEPEFWLVKYSWASQFEPLVDFANVYYQVDPEIEKTADSWCLIGYQNDYPIVKIWSPGA